MSSKYIIYCDLCGKEITDPEDQRKFKIKELKNERWKTIDAHKMCLWELFRKSWKIEGSEMK